jgi:hypothetical protein
MGELHFLNQITEAKRIKKECLIYEDKLKKMDRLDLLEEMVRYQEQRSNEKSLTLKIIYDGLALFKLISETCETPELRLLSQSYHRHLSDQLTYYLKRPQCL